MIILLEGPDGAGKSTLAQQLARSLQGLTTCVHHGPYPELDAAELSKTLFRSLAPALIAQSHVIMDRCWLSEPIYAAAYGRPSRHIPSHQRMLERCAMAGGAVVVRCLPPYEVCRQAWASGREEYLTAEAQLKSVYEAYQDLAGSTDLPIATYDYTRDNYDELWATIQQLSAYAKGPGAGAWRPGEVAVLVGDRPNMRGHGADTIIVPFVNFNGSGCSGWLANQLDHAGIRERDLYWINAANARGIATDPSFLADLKPKVVVAMGLAAAQWCEEHRIEHVTAPHPQHHKRFFYNKPYKTVATLKEHLHEPL